jgi:signal transduction histidine kinase/ActR/RegA family two-component response regulator
VDSRGGSQLSAQPSSAAHRRWPLAAAFALVAIALIASAAVMVASMRADARRRAGAQLEAVAALKVEAITAWTEDRVEAARYAGSYPVVTRVIRAGSAGQRDPALTAHVAEVFTHLAQRRGYRWVALVDLAGRTVVVSGPGAPVPAASGELVRRALADPRGVATQLDVTGDGAAALDVAVTLPPGEPAAALCLLRADAAPLVDDVVESWPVPSDTGSVALLRADGDDALLFPRTRDRPPAGFFRIPRSNRNRAAVRALNGERGLIEGIDQNGKPILVVGRPIPGTEWLLRTRIDRGEVMRPLRGPTVAIGALVALFLLTCLVLVRRWWRDDARRAAAEEALRRSQERLELAITGTHGVWDWDVREGRFQMEGELARSLGLPPEGLRGDVVVVLSRFVHPDDRAHEIAAVEAHLRGDAALYESEHRVLGPSGLRWMRVRGQVVSRDPSGRPVRMAGVASDVTDRRRLQGQLDLSQRMAGLGRLAAGVAHEINNPLSSIVVNLGFVDEALAAAAPEVRQALSESRDAAERVGDVVRGLKTFSSPGAAARGPVDVRAELEAALRLARHELRHRAALTVRIGDLPAVVAGAHELGQVFLNLAINAAQSIPEGRAEEQRVEVDAGTDANGWVMVEIRDTGVGIPTDVLDRIFEPFFTTKPLGVGTGLGLAIAHGIVTGAGGRIEVESRVGHGSLFRVLLPPSPSQRLPPPARSEPAATPAAAGAGAERAGARPRILVIDDEPLVGRAMVRALGNHYQAVISTSAADGLRRLEAGEPFDAIVCDLMMPQMTGIELQARISARMPALAARMVFVTGGAFTEAATEFLRATPNGWIEKPFDPRRLREAVERAIAG